jgi:putative membrane protein
MAEITRGGEPAAEETAAAKTPQPMSPDSSRAREHLANERTLLAWNRTSLALIGLGFIVARFGLFVRELESPRETGVHPSVVIGIALVAAGLVASAVSVARFFRARSQINRGDFRAEYWPEIMLTGLIVVLGVAMAVYLGVTG